jgi:hypothetical protein
MSIFRRAARQLAPEEEAQKHEMANEADSLMRSTLETVENGLRVKREVREKAARFSSQLRAVK